MALLSSTVLFMITTFSFLRLTKAATLPNWHNVRQVLDTDVCTDGATIPDLWAVHDIQIAYSRPGIDENVPSNATFSVTNTRTNATENLTCELRALYTCEFNGTPGHKDLSIWLQLNLRAYVTITQTHTCEGGKTASIVGMAEMPIVCVGDSLEEGMTCADDGSPGYATATVEVESLASGTEP
ncbi:hypothetical protein B0H66DRAFT_620648 [Apodospora peruviana]|uniref:Uncharacterized protein n=1 Tax=Apodospora peruviana TaxID=516989 RepID=A0AAE0ID61_9PEZI|nr:hypothetical protein B0H66DRAFT_620648 [Apodospora peruviana]